MMTLSDKELLHDVGIVSALYIPSIPESYFASALAGLAHTHTHTPELNFHSPYRTLSASTTASSVVTCMSAAAGGTFVVRNTTYHRTTMATQPHSATGSSCCCAVLDRCVREQCG